MEIICRKISYAGCNTRVKFLVVLSVLLSICSGMLSIVFAYIVKITVDYATNDLRYSFVETVANIVRLLLLMVTIDLSRNIVIAKTIFYVNSNIKSKLFRSFFDNQKRNHDTDFISVLSNDISVIESDYLRAGFDFAALITTCTISSIALFTYSIAHGALILGTSIFLVAISYLLKDKVGSKRLVVSTCNEHYISKVKDMFYGGLVIRQFLAISRMSNEHDEVNKELEKSKQRFLLFTSSVNIHESKRIFI